MDAANGNLHIEIPIASIPERGSVPFVAKLVYDSHIWQQAIVSGHKTWQATNIPNSYGGWRLETSAKTGPSSYTETDSMCTSGRVQYTMSTYNNFYWTEPDGRQIRFPITTVQKAPCTGDTPTGNAIANDGSGYHMYVTNYTNVGVYGPDGTLVYPNMEDTNGNYYSAPNGNGDVADTLGRTPITTTVNGNTIYYDVLNSTGGTSRYTVALGTISADTSFGQSGVTECSTSCTFAAINSVTLPDNTVYSFQYDGGTTPGHYGTLTKMFLPTTGEIDFTNTLFKDAFNNYYLYLSSYSEGTNKWSYLPAVVTSCGTTCSQTLTVTQPDTNQDQEQYTFTMYFNQMWNTEADTYNSSITSGTLLQKVVTTYSTSAPIQPTQITTTFPMASGSLSKQTKITWDSTQFGNVMNNAEWLFQPTSFSSTADRTTAYTYLSNSNNNMVNKKQTMQIFAGSNPNAYAETVTNYDEVATSSEAGVIHHDDTDFGTSYSPRGNATSVVRYSNRSGIPNLKTVLAYDMTGQVTQVTDPNSNVTKFSYADKYFKDSSSGPITTTPSGPTNAFVTQVTLPSPFNTWTNSTGYFLGSGKIAETTDQNSATSTFDFMDGGSSDYFDRPSEAQLPVGWNVMTYPSSTDQEVDQYVGIADTTPSSSCSSCVHTQTSFDALGRTITQALLNDPDASNGPDTVTTTFDSASRVSSITNPYRSTSDSTYGSDTYTYDGLGRVIQVKHYDGTSRYMYYGAAVTTALGGITSQLCASATYGYGFPILFIDEAGKKRETWTDGFGRIIEVDEPDNSNSLTLNTCYAYDVLDNLTGVTQGTQTRSYTYDGLSRLAQTVTPESGTVTYSYSLSSTALCSGNATAVCSRTDARGTNTTYSYDSLNRLTGITYSDSTHAVTYTYDSGTNQLGFRTGMSDGSGSTTWTYNAMGWPTSENRTITIGTNNISKTISYTYNQDGSLATLTYPSGRMITYTMSAAERLLSAKDVANNVQYAVTASYAAPGELNNVFYGPAGGIKDANTFNSRQQIATTAATVGTTKEQSLAFNYPTGNNGTLLSITNNVTPGLGESFTYDSLDRILTASTQSGTGTGCWGQSFGPAGPPPPGPPDDRWGNLTQINSTQCSVTGLGATVSSSTNQMTLIASSTPTYDSAGNMTGDTLYTYSFDAENHLTQASGMTGGPWNYQYDGNGMRVEKSTSTTNGTLYWRAVTGETIAESDLTGSTTNSAYMEYIFFNGERIASRNGSSGAVNYYYTDQLGSIVTITDGNGTPCYEATFTPYGQEMPTSLSWTCSTNYKFTGYERDSETGLDYAFARYYSPRLGRFMSADPLAGDLTDPQSLNRYAYVENNPDTFMDPLGLARCVLPDGTVSWSINKRACKEEGGTWQPDPPPPGTIFPTCTGVGPCVIGPVNPTGPGAKQKPKSPNCKPNPATSKQHAEASAEAALLTAEFFSGLGQGNQTFGPNTATAQVMAQSAGVQDALNQYTMLGTSSGLYTFGLVGLYEAGANPVAQFVGSFRWSISSAAGGINLTVTNTTSFKSLTYDRGPQWQRSSSLPTPMGNIHQTMNIFIPCK
ncbi:MAG TPA: RHS repeat-associated core domain-containing protein [Candidatus Acidoferrales bacterium]|nr:RHS repeat-associated core domain-containing protein [Candidatus Acidoferrales bacterium]